MIDGGFILRTRVDAERLEEQLLAPLATIVANLSRLIDLSSAGVD